MPPYNPPNTHYAHISVSDFSDKEVLKFIGKDGNNFKRLTERLGLEYVWWNKDLKVIELWGSFNSLKYGAKEKFSYFLNRSRETTNDTEDANIIEDIPAPPPSPHSETSFEDLDGWEATVIKGADLL